jgi:hypothetical protein
MGIESKTFTVGQDAITLVVEDALASRVRARQITNNTILMAKLRMLGFKKLKYSNGFEGEMFPVWGFDQIDDRHPPIAGDAPTAYTFDAQSVARHTGGNSLGAFSAGDFAPQ